MSKPQNEITLFSVNVSHFKNGRKHYSVTTAQCLFPDDLVYYLAELKEVVKFLNSEIANTVLHINFNINTPGVLSTVPGVMNTNN